jgi:hypothetical protein
VTDMAQADRINAYNELCSSYHAIDDFRTKLLGLLPLVTGGGVVLLSGRVEEIRMEFFRPVGVFGILVTLGLLAYELFGIKKCHALIETGKALESRMNLPVGEKQKPAGQFNFRSYSRGQSCALIFGGFRMLRV